MNSPKSNASSVRADMGLTEIPFQGASMNPLLKNAESVLVDFLETPTELTAFHPGDVVLYKEARGEWVCHRYLGFENGAPLLKGDFNTTLEAGTSLRAWGLVRGFIRGGRVYGLEAPMMSGWLCAAQRRQCAACNIFAKKFYRVLSRSILFANQWFSIRKYNHRQS